MAPRLPYGSTPVTAQTATAQAQPLAAPNRGWRRPALFSADLVATAAGVVRLWRERS